MSEFGFLNLGYDKDGYNKKGYNRQGFDREGYNKFGFNKEGYNRQGYDKYGYDQNGFDAQGYNKEGYDKEGYDKHGYDLQGYDRQGRNRQGYDKEGFDIDGYDYRGYDSEGYNKAGYNLEGFNREGFNRQGYDRQGFNKQGFDKEGYNKLGYNRNGYNRQGFDCNGFDENGYNYLGFDRWGYDQEGYDQEGYNINGFNREGYDRQGYDENGYNKFGINIWGYDLSWQNEEGFNPYGYDEKGYDKLGYDKYGFDKNGVDQFGHHREEFDAEGYHLKTGFNQFGFNRQGYNINGVNENGESFSYHCDLPTDDYDDNGYSIDGMPLHKFDANLYLSKTIKSHFVRKYNVKTDKHQLEIGDTVYHRDLGEATIVELEGPYCTVIFTKTNVKMKFRLFDDYLTLEPSKKVMEMDSSFDEEDNTFEVQKLESTIKHIKNVYAPILKNAIERKWTEKSEKEKKTVINISGLISVVLPDFSDKIDAEYDRELSDLVESPYFARVKKGKEDFYIGKKGTDTIVHWQSPKCEVYYQYQRYVGISSEDLNLIRDFIIMKSKLFGYIDRFNSGLSDSDLRKYADEHLKKIISVNRDNKGVHDIISSIQQNQYEIMIEKSNNNLLIIGCAGSGKTMIMLHRLSYLLYNDDSLSVNNIFVLSPTRYLSFENSLLSETLNLGEIHKFTIADMYKFILEKYSEKYDLDYHFADEIKVNVLQGKVLKYGSFFTDEYIDKITKKIHAILNASTKEHQDFVNAFSDKIEINKNRFYMFFKDKSFFEELKKKTEDFIDFCRNASAHRNGEKGYSFEDISKMLSKNKSNLRNLKRLYSIKIFVEYFLQNNCFIGHEKRVNIEVKNSIDEVSKICDIVFSFLDKLILNQSLVEEKLYSTYDNKTEAIESILNVLYTHNKLSETKDTIELFDGLRKISSENAKFYLQIINKVLNLESNEDIPMKIAILEDLRSKSWLFVRHSKDDYETPSDKKIMERIIPIYQAFNIDFSTMKIGKNFRIDNSINSVFDFFRAYQLICDKEKRLNEFVSTGHKNPIIADLIGFVLGKLEFYNSYKISNDYEAFIHCAIMQSIYGTLSFENQLICIDEFQDMSLTELKVLKSTYPNAVFNFYGDFKQCITPKGNLTEKIICKLLSPIKIYHINENYRNAEEITNYINQLIGLKMFPIGVKGLVEHIKYRNFSNFRFEKGDRIVYLAKDHEHLNYTFMQNFGVLEGWKGNQAKSFPANVPVALSVQEVKGLEFEVVIVDFTGMSENEKYVAATRALNCLYIIK